MGIESYFIKLGMTNNMPSLFDIKSKMLSSKLKVIDNSKSEESDDYIELIVDDALLFRAYADNLLVVDISVESCLSWFDDSISSCFILIKTIDLCFPQAGLIVSAGGTSEWFQPNDAVEFRAKVLSVYETKLKHFIERYPTAYYKCLPGEKFYKQYSEENSFWKKIFRFFIAKGYRWVSVQSKRYKQ